MTPHEILPIDDDVIGTFTFYLKGTASDGILSFSSYLGPYSLYVGCNWSSAVTLLVEDPLFQTVANYALSGSFETYTWPEFVTSPADCGIASYSIKLAADGTSLSNPVIGTN